MLEFVPVPPEFDQQVADGLPLPAGHGTTSSRSSPASRSPPPQPGTDPNGLLAVDIELKETARASSTSTPRRTRASASRSSSTASSSRRPSINARNFDGQAQISGNFTPDEMNALVTVLKFGSLPLEIREVGFSSISATLGLDFLTQTLLAGVVGIALVFVFMLVYYRVPGLVACIALIVYTIFTYAALPARGA